MGMDFCKEETEMITLSIHFQINYFFPHSVVNAREIGRRLFYRKGGGLDDDQLLYLFIFYVI